MTTGMLCHLFRGTNIHDLAALIAPSVPRSIIQSAQRITSKLCSITRMELPLSTRRCITSINLFTKNDKAVCVTTHRIDSNFAIQATPIATTPIATTSFQPPTALSPAFFCRPAQEVAPELIGCLLLKRQTGGELLGGVIVETEAYCQSEPACHGHRRRSPSNETLFGEPGHWYVYVSYGIHHCVNRAG